MTSASENAPSLDSLLDAGMMPVAIEAGRRWASDAPRRSPVLILLGGTTSDRSTLLRAIAEEARSHGRNVSLIAGDEIEGVRNLDRSSNGLLVENADALARHPAACELLLSSWEEHLDRGLVLSFTSASAIDALPEELGQRIEGAGVAHLEANGEGDGDDAGSGDEFGDFLADVSTVVAGFLDEGGVRQKADANGDTESWLGEPPPERSLMDYVALCGADSVGARVAREVLAAPGASYNPLTVWAPAGTGKTTLLSGLARAYRERYPDHLVAFLEAGREAPATDPDRISQADLLVIDDLDEAADLEALAGIAAALVTGRGQVVVSCGLPLDALDLPRPLDAMLRAGVVVAICTEVEAPPKDVDGALAAVSLLAANECADWLALEERIIEEPG